MLTVIDRQIEAFGESVREGPLDTGGTLQDMIHAGIAVSRLVIQRATQYQTGEHPTPEAVRELIESSRQMLGLMVAVQCGFETIKSAGLRLTGEDEFEDAVVELRELIAFLHGVVTGMPPVPPASDSERALLLEDFRQLAESHPPPQSWFEEDFKTVAGPGRR